MLRFDFLDARHGDCFLVRWGDGRVMLVDGGPSPVYQDSLLPYLETLPPTGNGRRHIDVVCVTHVDDDHIAGIERLLTELSRKQRDGEALPFQVGQTWFNAADQIVNSQAPASAAAVRRLLATTPRGAASIASIAQGQRVRTQAKQLGIDLNVGFPDRTLLSCNRIEVHGLDVKVVAPDTVALDALLARWRAAESARDAGIVTAGYTDYSIPNLSSTVLLIEHLERRALLTGDARGDRILSGLEECKLLKSGARMHVDLLKLPHHGSNNNVTSDFFERIHADHYVISADGVAHHHPNEQTLTWLVQSRSPEDIFTIHLTNSIEFAEMALQELAVGRRFRTAVRHAAEPAAIVSLGAKAPAP
ncbi:ComEC/Rec2 family competence protein [Actinomycetospora straminea]|uniref:MBL fold metallo-hydrolase n=1 Tax=Actinomycetospora straminea TaxID=663607 RepID=A0ABP9EH19_9PSEU|nr:MBL fold metallo-hydrolase [Actinomycetospora straminea]MDD7933743.1 MBL fold metallo-hydrolase [Actinomycetospora straminea]